MTKEHKILFVDDDPRILKAIWRQFDDKYELTIAKGAEEGLKAMRDRGPFALVVSDMQMPGMTGIQMLNQIKEISPGTVRIILTGFTDLPTAVELINHTEVFRLLSKPCPKETLETALQQGIKEHIRTVRILALEKAEALGRTNVC